MTRRISFAYLSIAALVVVLANVVTFSQSIARDAFTSFGSRPVAAPADAATPSPFDQWAVQDRPSTHITVRPPIQRSIAESSRAYCVRTCDGRYFPMSSAADASKELCKNSCPAAETRLYSGSSIETASADGKPYSKIANAFRFRNETVPGCSCQSSGRAGLAHIRIEDDKTIRVGDIVAQANGLMVASHAGRNGMIFARLRAARVKAERLPAIASR